AAELASAQRITASALRETGTVHHIVPERDDDTPESLAIAVAAECATHLTAP
ncbi:MAG: hypothetical protein QOF10_4976, partial [Kribbellaceae bacterium]|nr:hypothetical protein [Kribbellaceae bacterium]